MALPSFLLVEVRAAFQSCAKQHAARRTYPFSSLQILKTRASNGEPKHSFKSSNLNRSRETQPSDQAGSQDVATASIDLVSNREVKKSLEKGRKFDVPMRVLPKSRMAPKVRLSPQERLHIEHLTRHPPPQRPQRGKPDVSG
jgi:hypothetical protein